MNSSIYIQDFCGEEKFLIWDESHHNFGLCFQKSILCGLSYGLLAIFSAFYIGKETTRLVRSNFQRTILIIRFIMAMALFLLAVVQPCLLAFYAHDKLFWVDIFIESIQVSYIRIYLLIFFKF